MQSEQVAEQTGKHVIKTRAIGLLLGPPRVAHGGSCSWSSFVPYGAHNTYSRERASRGPSSLSASLPAAQQRIAE